jgi:predicted RNA-binding protein with PIN domain
MKMNENIIIDGYNLIRQSEALLEYEKINLETGRDKLIKMLCAYKRIKPHKIVVVFDGWEGVELSQRSHMERGIRVIFSKRGQKADEVIKNIARESGRELLIVTSDLDIKNFAEKNGNVVISSHDFLQKMEMAQYLNLKGMIEDDESGYNESTGTKKKGNPRKLPKGERKKKRMIKKL